MKKNLAIASIAAVMAALGLPAAAQASDGTITFKGAVTDSTCSIDVNGSNAADATVVLPTVTVGALNAVGKVAGAQNFTVKVSGAGCTGGPTGKVRTFFEMSQMVDPDTFNLKNQSGQIPEVQVQLVDTATGNAIKPGDAAQSAGVAVIGNAATMTYTAQYYAKAPATAAGKVSSSVTYSIDYL